jgi:hypothetical protein
MTGDFAREFYDLIPPTLAPNVSNSRSFNAQDSTPKHHPETNYPNDHHDLPSAILSPAKAASKVVPDLSASFVSSASKKAFAARQRYVGLASARSPLTSRSRFDLGLDSPGTPPPAQPPSRTHSYSAAANASARANVKPSSSDGVEAALRARLSDLDGRLLQVNFACASGENSSCSCDTTFMMYVYDAAFSLKSTSKVLL